MHNKSLQLCSTLCDLMNYSLPGPTVHGDYAGKNTGVGWHFLLQGEIYMCIWCKDTICGLPMELVGMCVCVKKVVISEETKIQKKNLRMEFLFHKERKSQVNLLYGQARVKMHLFWTRCFCTYGYLWVQQRRACAWWRKNIPKEECKGSRKLQILTLGIRTLHTIHSNQHKR